MRQRQLLIAYDLITQKHFPLHNRFKPFLLLKKIQWRTIQLFVELLWHMAYSWWMKLCFVFFRRIYCMFIVLQDTVRYPVRKSSADVRWSVDEAHTHTPLLQCYSYPQRANGGTLLKCIRAYDAVNAARQHSINFLLLNSCTVWYIATNTEHIHTPID